MGEAVTAGTVADGAAVGAGVSAGEGKATAVSMADVGDATAVTAAASSPTPQPASITTSKPLHNNFQNPRIYLA